MTSPVNHAVRSSARKAVWTGLEVVMRPTARWRSLPDYLIIGAQRSGTTSLQDMLAKSPDVKAPLLRKGVHFFDTSFARSMSWYRTHFPLDVTKGNALTGEASPYYLFHPSAADRIEGVVPDVKLIALLRDPVERAISHYKHEVRRGFESLEMEDALRAEPERLEGTERLLSGHRGAVSFAHQHFSYVARGRYAEQLRRYTDRFPSSQILVLEAEEFWESPRGVAERVAQFLGIRLSVESYPHRNATKPMAVGRNIRNEIEARLGDANRDLGKVAGRSFRWL